MATWGSDESARRVRVKSDSASGSISACFNLTPSMVRDALVRLRSIGWMSVVASFFFFAIARVMDSSGPATEGEAVAVYGAMAILVLGGAALAVVSNTSRVPAFVALRAGVLFEYLGAFALEMLRLCELRRHPVSSEHDYALILPWIVIFGFTIPAKARVAFPIALVAASMAPLVFEINRRMGWVDSLDATSWFIRFLPVYVTAIITAILSTKFYALGRSLESARQIGSYKLTNLIGSGGMGEVWRAEHRMLSRCSAIKLIRPEVVSVASNASTNPQTALTRFEREARATAALRSPHSVEIYDFGVTQDGRFYYVMELLDGMDLDSLLKRFGPIPASRAIYFLLQICDSLSEAHDLGLIHRDIKPKNIFVCRLGRNFDFVKVLDFGLVKQVGGGRDQSLTQEGTTTGTPAYLAPEAARGSKEIDARSDIYSLGCVAYWMLTGQTVFEGATAVATILKHVTETPIPPSQRTENAVPADLEKVILRCLEKEPGRRPQTAEELSVLLAHCHDAQSWRRKEARAWWQAHLPASASAHASTCEVQQIHVQREREDESKAATLL
ncbi:MAG: serine/threonine protein kinase [Bryobacterales bacterium]|nr:serine/threonine protein kinase [Bryobacterales bacterium]